MSLKFGKYIIEENEKFGNGGYGNIYLAKVEKKKEIKNIYM